MRVVFLVISFLAVAPVLKAQTAPAESAPPEIQVIKYSWSKERLNWQQNPFGGPNENFHEMQFRARSEKRVSDAKRSGNSAEISKLEKDAKADAAIVQAVRQNTGPPRYVFLYRSSVRNGSSKTITELDWDYVFFDAVTGEELGRREFSSVQKNSSRKKQGAFLHDFNSPDETHQRKRTGQKGAGWSSGANLYRQDPIRRRHGLAKTVTVQASQIDFRQAEMVKAFISSIEYQQRFQ